MYPPPYLQLGTVDKVYDELELPPRGLERRKTPYVIVNMISSVNGRASVCDKASGLGTVADRTVMRTLRSKADAVMIGGGTLRAEKLSLGLDSEDTRPVPLAVVATSSGEVPLNTNLIRDDRQRVLVLLSDNAPEVAESRLRGIADEVLRVPEGDSGRMDPVEALSTLRSAYAIETLLVEGGPTLNGSLTRYRLVDELFVTLAPKLVGLSTSETPPILDGPLSQTQTLQLLSAYSSGGELFLRYSLDKGDAQATT